MAKETKMTRARFAGLVAPFGTPVFDYSDPWFQGNGVRLDVVSLETKWALADAMFGSGLAGVEPHIVVLKDGSLLAAWSKHYFEEGGCEQ